MDLLKMQKTQKRKIVLKPLFLFRKWKIRKIEIRYEKYTFFLNGGFFSALMITSFSKGKIQAYLRSNLKEILKGTNVQTSESKQYNAQFFGLFRIFRQMQTQRRCGPTLLPVFDGLSVKTEYLCEYDSSPSRVSEESFFGND